MIRYLYNAQSEHPDKAGTHLTPPAVVTLLPTLFPKEDAGFTQHTLFVSLLCLEYVSNSVHERNVWKAVHQNMNNGKLSVVEFQVVLNPSLYFPVLFTTFPVNMYHSGQLSILISVIS